MAANRLLLVTWAAAALTLGISGSASDVRADSPAKIAPQVDPAKSFEAFAESWLSRMRNRQAPVSSNGGGSAMYREVSDRFEIEVKPTGDNKRPYVGILRYTEREFSCANARRERCRLTETMPVTEIFPMEDGRWVY